MTHKYKVGDTVLVVGRGYNRNAEPQLYDGTVTKVGRKWVHVEYRGWAHELFDRDTGAVKSEHTPRTFLYPAREAYEAERRLNTAWQAFRAAMAHRYTRPAHLTAETLESWTTELTRADHA